MKIHVVANIEVEFNDIIEVDDDASISQIVKTIENVFKLGWQEGQFKSLDLRSVKRIQ